VDFQEYCQRLDLQLLEWDVRGGDYETVLFSKGAGASSVDCVLFFLREIGCPCDTFICV